MISLPPVRSQAPRGEARQGQAGAAPTSESEPESEPALVSVECQGSVRVRHSRGWHSRGPGGIIGHSSWHHITCCRSLASAWILSDMRTVTSDTKGQAEHLWSVWCEKKVLRNFIIKIFLCCIHHCVVLIYSIHQLWQIWHWHQNQNIFNNFPQNKTDGVFSYLIERSIIDFSNFLAITF